MKQHKPLLSVENVSTSFQAGKQQSTVVKDVSFTVQPGEIVAIVGESGSGKSVTSLSIMGLLKKNAQITGSIVYNGQDLLTLTNKQRRLLRGSEMSMIFQEPMSSLNPMLRIRSQIAEVLTIHQPSWTKKQITQKTIDLLTQVDIPNPEQTALRFPHQLSGGMRQRVMIAIALACDPKLLIADEPTTALDVTTQAQILSLIKTLNEKNGTGVVFITHDLSVVASIADRVLVMYAGRIVEEATVFDLFDQPKHPYTIGLIEAMPTLDTENESLNAIAGNPPNIAKLPSGCSFHPRCPWATDACTEKVPALDEKSANHFARCIHANKEAIK
ncbi:oligopeptide transport system ATP-binding protein [Alkalihalobacillus xiaoxiensis]|uniref:Oligopeptide transport system ATP-binding protein n=1 Tax=Shouchella xiaoxiensis TaxID=766895 RepID=A0ABS2SPA2_9BACI|nr:ABC transporter ATP-binding protein [Shouchella xiaoxiensis]MBM7837344.1 oligopeptide transport system ATP-binding protein [Shouchella xiaoxiensis]